MLFSAFSINFISASTIYNSWDSNLKEGIISWYHYSNDSSVGENYTTNNNLVYDYSSLHLSNGTTYGNITYNITSGYSNEGAFEFDGVNDYFMSNNFIAPNETTISFWVNYHSSAAAGYTDLVRLPRYFVIDIISGSDDDFQLSVTNSSGTATTYNQPAFGNKMGINVWTYLSFTINQTTLSAYRNGVLYFNGTFNGYLNGSVSNAIILMREPTTKYVNGSIDEFIMWNRSLSSSEINDLYNQYQNNCVSLYNNINPYGYFSICNSTKTINDSENDGIIKINSSDVYINSIRPISLTGNGNGVGINLSGSINNITIQNISILNYANTIISYGNVTNITVSNITNVFFNSSQIGKLTINASSSSIKINNTNGYNFTLNIQNIATSSTLFDTKNNLYLYTGTGATHNNYILNAIVGDEFRIEDYSCLVPYNGYPISGYINACPYQTYYLNATTWNHVMMYSSANSTFNCNNSVFIGDKTSNGYLFNFNSKNNITLTGNCTIINYSIGINLASPNNTFIYNTSILGASLGMWTNTNSNNLYLEGVTIINSSSRNIGFEDQSDTQVNFTIKNSIFYWTTGVNIYSYNLINSTMENNQMINSYSTADGWQGNGTGNIFKNNRWQDGEQYAYDLKTGFNGNMLINESFIRYRFGVYSNADISNNSIINSTVTLNSSIYLDGTTYSNFTGINFTFNTRDPSLYLLYSSNDNLIQDNDFTNSSTSVGALRIKYNSDNNQVIRNRFHNQIRGQHTFFEITESSLNTYIDGNNFTNIFGYNAILVATNNTYFINNLCDTGDKCVYNVGRTKNNSYINNTMRNLVNGYDGYNLGIHIAANSAGTGADGTLIEGNNITNVSNGGILVQWGDNTIIRNNYGNLYSISEKIGIAKDGVEPLCFIMVMENYKTYLGEGNDVLEYIKNYSSNNVTIEGNTYGENVQCYIRLQGTTNYTINDSWYSNGSFWFNSWELNNISDKDDLYMNLAFNNMSNVNNSKVYNELFCAGFNGETGCYSNYVTYKINKTSTYYRNAKNIASTINYTIGLFNITNNRTIYDEKNNIFNYTPYISSRNVFNMTLTPNQSVRIQDYNCIVPFNDILLTSNEGTCPGSFNLTKVSLTNNSRFKINNGTNLTTDKLILLSNLERVIKNGGKLIII